MGRKKVFIDWSEYDRLKSLGYMDKEIAKIFGISPSVVSKKSKERRNKNDKSK